MPMSHLKKLGAIAVLLFGLQGGAVQAQTPQPELFLGFSSYHLRPTRGVDQRLDGFNLGGRYGLSSTWSLEAALNRQSGTEAGAVNLRQTGVVAGPRRSWVWNKHWQGFAHVLAGYEHLSAWEGPASDAKDSLALVAGIGADYALNSHVSFRVQEDYSQTHYAGLPQRSTCFNLGIVLRK